MSLLAIVLIIWVVVVAFVLALLRAAAAADRAAGRHAPTLDAEPAVPAAERPLATGWPDRTRAWLSPPRVVLWRAAGAAIAAAGMTVQRLGGVVALGVFAFGVC